MLLLHVVLLDRKGYEDGGAPYMLAEANGLLSKKSTDCSVGHP